MVRNMKEWQKKIISTGTVGAMPIMTYPGLALTGQSITEAATRGESQAACMEALADRYPSIASVSMMDLSVEAEAFGSRVAFSETEAPTVVGGIITDQASADALSVPPVSSARTSAYVEAVNIAARRIHDRPVLGGEIGPFSLASRLMEMKPLLLSIRRNPALVHTVLGKATDFLVEYAKTIKAAGANGIIIAEPAAGLVSPAECDAFSSSYVKKIVDAVPQLRERHPPCQVHGLHRSGGISLRKRREDERGRRSRPGRPARSGQH
jgi:uroporphyrinogen decarboxylase